MKQLALEALDSALRPGVTYADVRIVESRDRELGTKNGKPGQVSSDESVGIGIRVLADGCWGFAATDDLTRAGVESAAALAVDIARSSALAKKHDVTLAPEAKHEATWVSPCQIDPFSVSVEEQLALLTAVDEELRRASGVTLAQTSMIFHRSRQIFVSSIGSVIDQTRTTSGAGFEAYSFKGDQIQKRSYPNSFGGQHQLKGYELIHELDLLKHAPRVAEEAVALHSADQCPEGRFDLILDGSQLGLQVHESIGHPIELDRVLGSEANYAGMSFLTLDKLNHLRYGSDLVNAVCDARIEHGPGMGTFAFDDEGVPAQSADIIRNGQFVGYMTSRETAAAIGADAFERHHARHQLGAASADPHDQRQPAARRANARRSVRGRRPRHLHGDQSQLVHRRQALQLPVRLRNRLGDQGRQARAHAEEPNLQRHHHRVLECLRAPSPIATIGCCGAFRIAARDSPSK